MLWKSFTLVACGLLLKKKFNVETNESPLSKDVAPMPQVDIFIGTQESQAEFEVRIASAANLLVGNYNVMEHNAYQGLRHRRLNRVF
jgi:hypothetical protein